MDHRRKGHRMSEPHHLEIGRAGEALAEAFLKKRKFKCLARRFNTPMGELDLVMRDGDTLVFVEVKTLADRRLKDPQDAVTPSKQAKLAKAARWYTALHRCDDRPCRFDVVSVIIPPEGQPEIEHFTDVFAPERW